MAYDVHSKFDLEKHKQIGALRRLKMAVVYTGTIPKDNEYPNYLQRLSPAEKDVYLNGEWSREKEGE